MDELYFKKYEPIFGAWKIVRLIGEGSYGKVYEIERKEFGKTYKGALKAISVPQVQNEIDIIREDCADEESVTSYFRGIVEELTGEFDIMETLKGESTIVSYEDHQIIPHEDGIGWDILIRMELLTPLMQRQKENPLTVTDVVQLGMDICEALELCHSQSVVHRDIKPENIFISNTGRYKLGDFGIARTVEKTTGGLSKKGTYTYMAPEVYKGEAYGSTVDIFSLGIVLYRLLNKNRAPFLPKYPAPITHNDRETALARQLKGEPLPEIEGVPNSLLQVIRTASAFDPKHRYSRPLQMRNALAALVLTEKEEPNVFSIQIEDEEDKTVSLFDAQMFEKNNTYGVFPTTEPKETEEKTASIFDSNKMEKAPKKASKTPITVQKETQAEEKGIPQKTKSYRFLAIGIIAVVAACFICLFILTRKPATQYSTLQDAEVGSTICFGKYEQDNNSSNGKEDIEWTVLAKEKGKILVISKYVLACRTYSGYSPVTWENCSLRKWLNDSFLNVAFLENEREKIEKEYFSPNAHQSGTNDKVCLLNAAEAEQYFSSNADRKCIPTKYALAQGVSKSANSCRYWLRSSGIDQYYAAVVDYSGSVSDDFGVRFNNENIGVRPVMWIRID